MSKVFEALERERKNRKKENGGDPLAEIEAAEPVPGKGIGNESGNYELPSGIGSPVGPRSNDGLLYPSLNVALGDAATEDAVEQPPPVAPPANGKPVIAAEQSAMNGRNRVTGAREGRLGRPFARDKEITRAPHEIPIERVTLPQIHPRLILLTDPEAPECEQYRTLRTQLFHAAEKKPAQVVVVTSSLAGEGKTSTALNLALAIGQSKEKRVLVIDGDMRRPCVASFLGFYPKSGLNDVLGGDKGPLDTIVCLDSHNLYVLPVCRESSSPTELLSSGRLENMIEEIREYFDFILIDSPPVMPFADARLLANHSDTILLVVRAGVAPYETVEKAIEALPPGRILGVVLNNAEHLNEPYYDYYYTYSDSVEHRRSFWQKITGRRRQSGS